MRSRLCGLTPPACAGASLDRDDRVEIIWNDNSIAPVVELVDAVDSKSTIFGCGGSSPSRGTIA